MLNLPQDQTTAIARLLGWRLAGYGAVRRGPKCRTFWSIRNQQTAQRVRPGDTCVWVWKNPDNEWVYVPAVGSVAELPEAAVRDVADALVRAQAQIETERVSALEQRTHTTDLLVVTD